MSTNQLLLVILILTVINSLLLAFNIGALIDISKKVDFIDYSLSRNFKFYAGSYKNNSLDPKLYSICRQVYKSGKTYANMKTAYNDYGKDEVKK